VFARARARVAGDAHPNTRARFVLLSNANSELHMAMRWRPAQVSIHSAACSRRSARLSAFAEGNAQVQAEHKPRSYRETSFPFFLPFPFSFSFPCFRAPHVSAFEFTRTGRSIRARWSCPSLLLRSFAVTTPPPSSSPRLRGSFAFLSLFFLSFPPPSPPLPHGEIRSTVFVSALFRCLRGSIASLTVFCLPPFSRCWERSLVNSIAAR